MPPSENTSAAPAAPLRRGRRLPLISLLALVVAVVAALTAGAGTASAQTGSPAPQTLKKAAWGSHAPDGSSLFPVYQDLGVGIFQLQALWDQIAAARPANPTDPNDPAYLWPEYIDSQIAEAAQHGMTTAIQIIGTPSWASASGIRHDAPTNPADFGQFAEAIARRYPSVHLWLVWGEPNGKRTFHPVVGAKATSNTKLNKKQQRAPRIYAQMLDAAYQGLKNASPGNLVIGGNTFQGAGHPVIRTYQWLRYLKLPGGGRPRMDMWGHNPYTYEEPNLKDPPSERGRVEFSDLRRLMKALDKVYKRPKLKLFLSEWGVPTGFDQDQQFRVKKKAAVRWVRAAMKIVRKQRRIYTLGWVIPIDTERNPQGLLDRSLRPKPTYFAFKNG